MEKQPDKVRSGKTFIALMIVGLLIFGCIPQGSLKPDARSSPPPKIELFEANPPSVAEGGTSTLRWRTRNATSVHLTGVGVVSANGMKQVTVGQQGKYVLTATNSQGKSVTASRNIKAVPLMGRTPPGQRPPANGPVINNPQRVDRPQVNRPAPRPIRSNPSILRAAVATKPLPAPALLSPKNGARFNKFPRRTTLRWRPVKGASKYGVEIDCYNCCKAKRWCTDVNKIYKKADSLSGTTYTFNFAGAQPGRWRVWALDRKGRPGKKSAWQNFRYTR